MKLETIVCMAPELSKWYALGQISKMAQELVDMGRKN